MGKNKKNARVPTITGNAIISPQSNRPAFSVSFPEPPDIDGTTTFAFCSSVAASVASGVGVSSVEPASFSTSTAEMSIWWFMKCINAVHKQMKAQGTHLKHRWYQRDKSSECGMCSERGSLSAL